MSFTVNEVNINADYKKDWGYAESWCKRLYNTEYNETHEIKVFTGCYL
jgi:hypothetical protein